MKELLPFAFGLVAGCSLAAVERRRLRSALTIAVALVGGACASAINGELGTSLWPLFVSLDAILVYVGLATSAVLLAAHVPGRLASIGRRNRQR